MTQRNRKGSRAAAWRAARLPALGVAAGVLGAGLAVPAAGTSTTPSAAPSPPATVKAWLSDDGEWGDDDTGEDEKASAATGSWRADHDQGSVFTVTKQYGAQDAWGMSAPTGGGKLTGKGIDVAVIDTGVSPVAGLDRLGKIVNGPDLSFESQAANTRHLDGYGHGTHMAGIIAGRDRDVQSGGEKTDRSFVGVAPDARIVNMKVAAADGGADVSQVIAAINWVTQHARDPGLNIRVINLSYGTRSTQSYVTDPLAHAVEAAWRKGIVVVVAAGNDGRSATALTMPAADPHVLAVGAVDHRGSDTRKDDVVADFTNGGASTRRPDLIAPGKSVVSLRVPGSFADRGHPEGLVTGDAAQRFFRGSGTSQAAAVVSGSAALLLQQRPHLTPDQVKKLLTTPADRLESGLDPVAGRGVLDLKGSLETPTPTLGASRQVFAVSNGTGSLEASRGGSHVTDPANGIALTGEQDIFGTPWDARRWSSATTTGTSWAGGEWNARRWSGAAWSGSSWSGVEWSARRWSSDVWSARRWSTSDFTARRWSSENWVARAWSGQDWTASRAW